MKKQATDIIVFHKSFLFKRDFVNRLDIFTKRKEDNKAIHFRIKYSLANFNCIILK